MTHDFLYDVFLSHNSKDKPRVRRLAERLKQAGLRVWFDEWNIRSGDIIALKVDEGLEQARVLLLCISPNALASGWVALERSTAIHRDPSNQGRRFIPLLLADCELPDTLRRYKYVDFQEESNAAFAEILTACMVETAGAPLAKKPTPKKTTTKRKVTEGKLTQHPEALARLERKLSRHHGWIRCVAISTDGKWAASGANDNKIKIWDLDTGECRATLERHVSKVTSVAITPDGMLHSASQDSTVCSGDLDGTRNSPAKKFSYHWVLSIRPVGDGMRFLACIAVANETFGKVVLWNWSSGVDAWIAEQNSVPYSVCVSLARGEVICGLGNGDIRVLDLETGKYRATLTGHSKGVFSLQATTDGRVVVSGSDDTTVKVWDLETGTCIGTLEGHQESVYSVAISPDGSIIASTGFADSTVRLWDWKSGVCLQVIESRHHWLPYYVEFSPDGSRLVVGTTEGTIYVYSLTKIRPIAVAETPRRYVNAKVVLIGESTVGKTTLAHRLIDDRYVKTDSTHGMNVWRLELPLPDEEVIEREALLWDLAGQMGYREIHQLFLDQTALALLLINPQRDDPFAETGDWLKALKSAGAIQDADREVAKLLITTRCDVGGVMVSEKKVRRFLKDNDFKDWLSTGSKSGENCSDSENGGQPSKLKQLIAKSIPWDNLPWTSTPRLLAELKNAVVAMRDDLDIRLLRFAELAQRLEQALPGEKFGESEVRTAVTLLANHGLARTLKFGDLVLLQPELLNGYAGAIIRAARAHTDEIGCVLEWDIYQPGFDFTGVERLTHRADEELLLRALVQIFLDHSLCIAEETPQGRQLVFPSQYRREKDIPRDPDIFVSYSFSGEWQTVWTTLVVRLWYSQEFEHRELWRNAAEFASGKGHTLGLKIHNKPGEGIATISLYFDIEVPEELKAIFIEYVHRHLAKFGCDVSRDRRYVCPNPKCSKPVKDIDEVRERLGAGKTFIYCQKCDKKVPLIDFIEQRLKSDPVARKILAMDATATRELDSQALEQILIGHLMAIAGEANQIFRPVTMFDHGIDGEVEFKNNNGQASGKKIYLQLKSGNSYLRTRKSDGSEVFDVTNDRHLKYWISQPVEVYLVIRQTDETSGAQSIRWMNVTRYLKSRKDKNSRQVIFKGDKLDMEAMWKVRDKFFPPKAQTRK